MVIQYIGLALLLTMAAGCGDPTVPPWPADPKVAAGAVTGGQGVGGGASSSTGEGGAGGEGGGPACVGFETCGEITEGNECLYPDCQFGTCVAISQPKGAPCQVNDFPAHECNGHGQCDLKEGITECHGDGVQGECSEGAVCVSNKCWMTCDPVGSEACANPVGMKCKELVTETLSIFVCQKP